MERVRKQKMTRGLLIFAFNSLKFNYYDMARHGARRAKHFLNLPVTLITDTDSLPDGYDDGTWDKVITVTPDKNNVRDWGQWINKGRYMAYELSPYDETILIDADYIINSDKLLKTFDTYEDFCCHDSVRFFMRHGNFPEPLSANSYDDILWATVITFKKTKRAKQIFECLEMVQKNYEHYEHIHGFLNAGFRNDYALTLALRIVNGHADNPKDFIPWNLMHIGTNTAIYPNNEDEFNTEYTIIFDNWHRHKIKKEYNIIKDTDFHLINKDLYAGIIQNG
jgi:hypothetical protein